MIKNIDLQFQYGLIKTELKSKLNEVYEKTDYIGGSEVKIFAENFSHFTGSKYCVPVANGTDALEIILESLNLQNKEIILPALTFVATAEAILRVGAVPVFADVDSSNTIDVKNVQDLIGTKTGAIIAVNLHGNASNLSELQKIANDSNIYLIQDSAQAHGTLHKEGQLGSFGIASAFSFYPGKTLGAFGDGGAITTNTETLSENTRRIANHGRLKKFDHEIVGRNSRLDTVQAAVLNLKLPYIDSWVKTRRQNASRYLDYFSNIDWIDLPSSDLYGNSSFHQFVIISKRKPEIESILSQNNIEFGYHYPYTVPELKPFNRYGSNQKFIMSGKVANYGISLPIGEHLKLDEIEFVAETILKL